ncbi:alpha/beta fold hydrolase [Anaerolentibacter hominis]|uniref:alpha/beta fold hydrolase n=1 Tax=Anaerolentibacter hominis TaxID=3079009 RepID=UPI0031B85C56
MYKTSYAVIQKDGYETTLYHYKTDKNPKASILLLHGMAEYCERYEPFAAYLTKHGYDFYTYNHRGHGSDNQTGLLGFSGERSGHNLIVKDAVMAAEKVQEINRSSHLLLMGHSFGSIVARNVLQHKDDFDGAIICGTANPSYPKIYAGLLLTSLISLFKGPRYISAFVDHMSFGGKEYKSLCKDTSFDWLTKDKEIVQEYVDSPLCGFTCTVSFFHDLLSLSLFGKKADLIGRTRRDLPLLFIAGDHDPVGGYGKDVSTLVATFQTMGFQEVALKLYRNDRHELLNEIDRNDVMSDILSWIKLYV